MEQQLVLMADLPPLSPRSPSSVRINIDFVCIQAQLMTKRHWASRSPLLLAASTNLLSSPLPAKGSACSTNQ